MTKETNETLAEDVLRINNAGNNRRKECNFIFPRDRKQSTTQAESLAQIAGKSQNEKFEPNKLPLEKSQARRIHRAIGFENVTESVSRWGGIVSQRRKAEQLVFPLEKVDCRVMTTEKNYRPSMKTSLEREVYGLLRGAQLLEEKKETEEELTIRKAMSLDEVRKESRRIAGERNLKQRLERKAALLNKSKSRKYHKILRREKLKTKKEEFETMKETNPEAAMEILNDIEKTRLQERMNLRHKNSKWLRLQRPRAGQDQMVRDLLKENSDMRKELLEKLQDQQKDADKDMEEDDDQEDQDLILKAQENAIKSGKFDAKNVWVSQLALPKKAEKPDESFLRMEKFWEDKKKEQQLHQQEEEKKALKVQQKRSRDQTEQQEEQAEEEIVEQVELNQWEEQKKKKNKKGKRPATDSKEKGEASGIKNEGKETNEEKREENTEHEMEGKEAVISIEIKKIEKKTKLSKIKKIGQEKVSLDEEKSENIITKKKVKKTIKDQKEKLEKKISEEETKLEKINKIGKEKASLGEEKNENIITKKKIKKTIKQKEKMEKENSLTNKDKLKINKNTKKLNKSLKEKSIDELFEELENRENREKKKKKLKVTTKKLNKDSEMKSAVETKTPFPKSDSKTEEVKPKQKPKVQKKLKTADGVCGTSAGTDLVPPKEEPKEPAALNVHAIESRRLGTARPDYSFLKRKIDNVSDDEFSDEGFEEIFDNEENVKLFEEEKKVHGEKSKLQDVDTYMAGWGSWGGPGIVPSEKKRRKFRIEAPKAPENKYAKIGNVIYNEKSDVHDNLRKMMVNELPFPFTTVKDFEASIRQPIGRTFVPEAVHNKLTTPPVVSKMGQVINPMSEEILVQQHDKSSDAPRLERQMDMKLGLKKKYKNKNLKKNKSKVKTLSVMDS